MVGRPPEALVVEDLVADEEAEVARSPADAAAVGLDGAVDMEAAGGAAAAPVAAADGAGAARAAADASGVAAAPPAAAAANTGRARQVGSDGAGSASVAGPGSDSGPVIRDATLPEQEAKRRRLESAVREVEEIVCDDVLAAPRRSGRLKRVSVAPGAIGDIATGGRGTVAAVGREARRVGASSRVAADAASIAARPSGPRIVRVGEARIDDLRAHDARVEAEAVERGTRRRDEGERGRMQDARGHDLDRSGGGPWRAGKRG